MKINELRGKVVLTTGASSRIGVAIAREAAVRGAFSVLDREKWGAALTSAALVTSLAVAAPATAETLLERGNYLVNAVMACDICHTPRGPNGLLMDKRFSGGSQTWDEPTYRVKGANITPDRDTGIGTWSADDIKRAMTEGIRPAQARLSGVPLAPIMPWAFHKILTPRDLDAVVAYVQTISPVRNEVPPPLYRAPMPAELVPGGEKPIDEAALRDPLRRGFYLVTIAHCMECHARRPDGNHDFVNWLGKGGHEMTGPYGSVIVRNITSDKTAGIGAWTDADIKRALTQGVSRDGRVFKPPMARQTFFSRMTEPDIEAIIAYLRTLPSLK